jgi:purine-nucleoside phosphorylase
MIFDKPHRTFLIENPVLNVADLVQWKRENQKYNIDKLPATAIFTLSKYSIPKKIRLFAKKIKGIKGFQYQINSEIVICSDFGNGAPAIVGVMEELRILGVENFVFIGLAGSLDSKFKENDVCIVTESFSTTGCASFYSENEKIAPKKNEWFARVQSQLIYLEASCWSTDAPYRETPSLLSQFCSKGATHVDMECAAIYAFASFYNLNAVCLLVTADSISAEHWFPPKSEKSLHKSIRKTLLDCLKISANE